MSGTRARYRIDWPTRVVRRDVPEGRRLIAVSDIHGNLPFFEGLLEKIAFSPDDILVLLGDMLEKGEQSLPLLRRIMELERTHTVWPLCGNCDGLVLRFFEDDRWDEGFFSHYLPGHPECTLCQMADEIGISDRTDLPALRSALRAAFAPVWQWLRALPTIIETEHLVFVHGGVPTLENMEQLNAWHCMKFDDFVGQGLTFPKYVVAGHWPVTLYRPHYPSAAPLLSRKQHILSIDGGCVLKLDGQLNAVLFPNGRAEDCLWTCFDGLPTAVALDAQDESENPLNIRWGRSEVVVLERGEEFSRCRHVESGRELDILTHFLHEREGKVWCEDATDYRLAVWPGDVLSVSKRTGRGVLAKKDGVTGWYTGRLQRWR